MHIKRARHAVGIVFLLLGTLIGVWATRIPDFKLMLDVDESGFGLVLLAMALGAVLGFPIAGYLIDRFGAASMSKVFAVGILIGFAILPLGASVAVILPLMLVVGFCIGTLDVAMNGWGAEVEKELGRPVMSSYHGLYSLGAGFGAGAGALALWYDLDLLPHFAGWSFLMAIPLVFALRTPWASEKTGPGGKRPPFVAIPKGGLFFVGIMALIAALGEGAITDWAALYQIQELGFDSSEAAVGFAVFSVAMVIMRFCGDQVIARFGAVPVARASGIAAALGCALLVWGDSIWMIWAGCAVMGLGNAVIFPLAMSRAAADPTMSKGAALASVATLGYGAFLFGPPILGFIGDAFSLRASFALVAILALLIAGLAGALKVRS
ncbi:MFS transporter [Roseibium polysiphoniae]|uniref:MFS transporter n=1 Tax=Roseibium polysiphoniae TaxID=2571221 RepID=UPI003297DAE5